MKVSTSLVSYNLIFLFTTLLTRTSASLLGLGAIVDILQPASQNSSSSSSSLYYTPYYRGPVCMPAEAIRHPRSADDIVAIVQEAISKNTTVKAIGHFHSETDIICTDGIPIDMRGLQGFTMNPDLTVTVGAGVSLHDLTMFLKANGRALKTTPAFGNITIGGAIGTGAHGSSIKYTSSISEQVVGLQIVDGLGQVRSITSDADLLAFRVHLGLLGIVLNVTLGTYPLYKVEAHNYVLPDDVIWNGGLAQMALETDQISVYWFPSANKVVVANWTIVDVSTPGEAYTNDHVPSTSTSFNFAVTTALEAAQALNSVEALNAAQALMMQTLVKKVPDFQPIYTYDGGLTVANPAVGYYNDMFAPICGDVGRLQCPWFHGPNNLTFLDNEIAVELSVFPQFATTLKDIVSKYAAVFPLQGILLRFSAATNTYMSVSQGRNNCHFEFYMLTRKDQYETPSTGLAAYQAMLQSLVFNYTGRSHWGKTGGYYHSSAVLTRNRDPTALASFVSKMNEYDPNGLFMNDFGRRLKGTGTKVNTDPLVTHCALLDDCVCSQNSDCAVGQVCSRIDGYPDYPVCITPGLLQPILDPNPYLPIGSTISQVISSVLGIVL